MTGLEIYIQIRNQQDKVCSLHSAIDSLTKEKHGYAVSVLKSQLGNKTRDLEVMQNMEYGMVIHISG